MVVGVRLDRLGVAKHGRSPTLNDESLPGWMVGVTEHVVDDTVVMAVFPRFLFLVACALSFASSCVSTLCTPVWGSPTVWVSTPVWVTLVRVSALVQVSALMLLSKVA